MHYPIFTSIVNTVVANLEQRGIDAKKLNTWENSRINATGLELQISLLKVSQFMESLSINFDWDYFRERALAERLDGMQSHPLLKMKSNNESNLIPSMDIELTWLFNVDKCQPEIPGQSGNYRIKKATAWMESISKQVNKLLIEDDIITRWHVEIIGDENGKYLSAINLISYFTYSLDEPKSVNEVNSYIGEQLKELLMKANKVLKVSEEILQENVAA